ncbi:MAG: hypothetical protein ACM3VT_03545 [Solirubrobacterales bacterium]
MSPIVLGLLVFGCVLGASLLGMILSATLPRHLLCGETKDIVRLAMGLVATMTALVLGLLVASAKGSYDTQKGGVATMAAKAVVLDRLLATYGTETAEVRTGLRDAMKVSLAHVWPEKGEALTQQGPDTSRGAAIYAAILKLPAPNDASSVARLQIFEAAIDLGQTQWLLYEQAGSSVSKVLLTIVIFWLTILFLSFGLFAPRNVTVIGALIVAALSVSTSLFLVMEFDGPFSGLIRVSNAPVVKALNYVGQ